MLEMYGGRGVSTLDQETLDHILSAACRAVSLTMNSLDIIVNI